MDRLTSRTHICREGPRMAASSQITINVKGKQGHGAQPHQAIDAIVVASAIVMNLQTVVSRNVSALDSLVRHYW